MKQLGEIVSISDHLGFIKLPNESKLSFDAEPNFNFLVGDIVEFDLMEITISRSGNSYFKAVNISLIERPTIDRIPQQIRLSKIAKQYNLSLGNLVNILNRHNIQVENNPNAKITNEQLSLVLNSITGLEELDEVQIAKRDFQQKYSKGKEIEVRISIIIPPSQIVTLFPGGFTGRLSVLDLAWSLPEAQLKFSNLSVNQLVRCKILDIDFDNKQVKLSVKHLHKPISESTSWLRLDKGDVLSASIQEDLANSYLIKSEQGFYGLISKEFPQTDITSPIKVKLKEKLDNADLMRVFPASLEIKEDIPEPTIQTRDFGFIEPELQSFNALKKSILGNHASDDDINLLEKYFSNNEFLFSKEIEAPFPWHITFELSSSVYETTFKQNAIGYFLSGKNYSTENEKTVLELLNKKGYWVRINKRKNDILDFSLFNEEVNLYGEIETSKDSKSTRCIIKNFSFGHTFSHASDAKKRNSKFGTFFLRSPLIITPPNSNISSDESNKKVIDYIIEKTQAFEIISKLKQEAGEILREEGRTLGLIDKFLEYQESLLERNQGVPVFVDKFERTNSDSGTVAIQIPQTIGYNLNIESEAIVNVLVGEVVGADMDFKWFSDAILTYELDVCKLSFTRDVSLAALNDGFYLEQKVSKSQIQIQRRIIQDFLQKKIKIDHIESLLVQPDKISPPIISTTDLINPDLVRTENEQPDNNQIKAVRKAIGNSNVFLIQGPPGTGKTTVISEIINQLVKKEERILVTGQNHVAVDNVLAKIAKNPALNLIRVGKEDKIDKELSKYHIDNLIVEYRSTFAAFLNNQVKLIDLYFDLTKQGKSISEIKLEFNKSINIFVNAYDGLKEILKHRHFNLTDNITELTPDELKETHNSFKSWIASISNELDILLQPLIFNSVDVVFGTCIGIKTDSSFRESGLRFDTVIVDEAGKANIAETLVAIELGEKVILVGDQMQLPPYIDSTLIDPNDPKSFPKSEYGYSYLPEEISHALRTSFFEFLITKISQGRFPKENMEMLNYQHRMHPNIGKFVSESFYGGKVLMGSKTHENKLNYPSPFDKEVVFFDTSNTPNPYEIVEGTSAKNNTEAEAIAEVILPILHSNQLPESEIAIIAPYKSQVANIKKSISNSTSCHYKNIDVSTLDSFQGKEYDVIIFSFTRSSNHEANAKQGKKPVKVGFLDDAKRLNVAFSRARKKLVLVGNAKTLVDRRSHFDLLFDYTGLFERLVRLSKKEEIGNFVNIANYEEFKSPFEKLTKKHKKGDKVIAKYLYPGKKENSTYGYFFSVEGIKCLLPISLIQFNERSVFANKESESEHELIINEIDLSTKRVSLAPVKKVLNYKSESKQENWSNKAEKYKTGSQVKGKVVKKIDFGFIIELKCGLEGVLFFNKITTSQQIYIGKELNVTIAKIDTSKKRINFTLR